MSDPADVADEDNWVGGFYELYLQLESDAFELVASALARAADLGAVELPDWGHWRGVVTSPLGRSVCGMFASTYDHDNTHWLTFYLPLGALGGLDRRIGGFPFGPDGAESSLVWRRPFDDWLARLGERVFVDVGFVRGVIGFEIDDEPETSAWEGHLLPVNGSLEYTPATR